MKRFTFVDELKSLLVGAAFTVSTAVAAVWLLGGSSVSPDDFTSDTHPSIVVTSDASASEARAGEMEGWEARLGGN